MIKKELFNENTSPELDNKILNKVSPLLESKLDRRRNFMTFLLPATAGLAAAIFGIILYKKENQSQTQIAELLELEDESLMNFDEKHEQLFAEVDLDTIRDFDFITEMEDTNES